MKQPVVRHEDKESGVGWRETLGGFRLIGENLKYGLLPRKGN